MSYSPTTPQANQTIAFTQPIILGNFAYIQTNWGVIEHNFNQLPNAGQADGTHLKCSMPDMALSPALPGGTTGVYYVNSGTARFYDGTNNFNLSIWTNIQTGSFTLTNSFATILTVPANSVGMIIFYQIAANGAQMLGTFCSDSSCFAWSARMKQNSTSNAYAIELQNDGSGSLNLEAQQGDFVPTSPLGSTYKYVLFSRPTT